MQSMSVAEFPSSADIPVERRHERAEYRRLHRIVFHGLTQPIHGIAGESRVEPPGDHPARPLQLRHELERIHTQIGLQNVVLAQAREPDQFLHYPSLLRRVDFRALLERLRIRSRRERARFLQERSQIGRLRL